MTEFNKEWGYTFDKQLKERRPLTEEEHVELEQQRAESIRRGKGEVIRSQRLFKKALAGELDPREARRVTVTFETEQDYVDFLDDLFDRFGRPRGLGFPASTISTSLDLEPWLLKESVERFHIRPLELSDYEKKAAEFVSPHPFDVANLEGSHVPGAGLFKQRKRRSS